MLMMTLSDPDFATTSRSLLESYGIGLTPVVISVHLQRDAHLCTFAAENRIELAQLGWSKSGVNDPFLSMVICPWNFISQSRTGFLVKLRTVDVQEARSRQKTDRLPKVRTFGVVVSPEYVLQRLRVREHKDIFLLSNQQRERREEEYSGTGSYPEASSYTPGISVLSHPSEIEFA
jgi:hypothetical protein